MSALSDEYEEEDLPTGEDFPVRPLDDRMVVREVKFDAESLLVMPDTAKSRLGARYGRVVAIGPGLIHPVTAELIDPGIKLGNVVMHREYSGTPFRHAGVPYLLLERDDCVSTVDEERFDPAKFLYGKSSASSSSGLPGLGNDRLIIPKASKA